jgi:riboflavin transporter FmnP
MQIYVKLKTNKIIIEFGIFGSLLPPLGLFSENKFVFLSLYQKYLFWQIKRSFKSKFDQMPKAPPFSIIKFLPHKIAVFAIKMILIKHK